jgi:hypothetical protein
MTNRSIETTLYSLERIVQNGICFPADVIKIKELILNATAQLRNEGRIELTKCDHTETKECIV